MQCFENEMARILLSSDCIFSRETYRALLAENQVASFERNCDILIINMRSVHLDVV